MSNVLDLFIPNTLIGRVPAEVNKANRPMLNGFGIFHGLEEWDLRARLRKSEWIIVIDDDSVAFPAAISTLLYSKRGADG